MTCSDRVPSRACAARFRGGDRVGIAHRAPYQHDSFAAPSPGLSRGGDVLKWVGYDGDSEATCCAAEFAVPALSFYSAVGFSHFSCALLWSGRGTNRRGDIRAVSQCF